ncbi:hypothetical protein [Solibacillus sp. FSL H8-0538]|uniref:hypothetical protein n=1 Tax=Solibacillus sp. FSL H8-0538 TaxID=2921400 RepID=UPI0030FB13C9
MATTNETKQELDEKRMSSMYQISRAEAKVQLAIYDVWYKHYTNDKVTTKYRNDMARVFNALWADATEIKVDKPFLRHPATRLKDFSRGYTIAEVLADFIMRIKAAEEKHEDYPVHGVDKVLRDNAKDRKRLVGIYSQDESDRDSAEDFDHLRKYRLPKQTTMSAYDMSEFSVVQQQSAVGERVIESDADGVSPMDIRKFKRVLLREKSKAKGYARLYANDGYDYDDALRRIRRLDVKRVRECIECGEVFYAHDNRRYVCDLQHGRVQDKVTCEWKRSTQSHCEVENAKIRSKKQRESA